MSFVFSAALPYLSYYSKISEGGFLSASIFQFLSSGILLYASRRCFAGLFLVLGMGGKKISRDKEDYHLDTFGCGWYNKDNLAREGNWNGTKGLYGCKN